MVSLRSSPWAVLKSGARLNFRVLFSFLSSLRGGLLPAKHTDTAEEAAVK